MRFRVQILPRAGAGAGVRFGRGRRSGTTGGGVPCGRPRGKCIAGKALIAQALLRCGAEWGAAAGLAREHNERTSNVKLCS
jgi:hypothetical protein